MEIKVYNSGGRILVRIQGRIVLDECDRMKSTIVSLITPGANQINLDLSEVDFIDSAGLGALVGIKVSCNKHHARLALVNPSRGVSDILMVSKLDNIFDIMTGPDAEDLVRELAQPQNQQSVGGPAAGPQLSRGPAMPAMPGMNIPRPVLGNAEESPKDRIDRLCRDAVGLMKNGNYDKAAECYREALKINPDYLPALNNLAIVYEKNPATHPQAIEAWRKVLELSSGKGDPKHIDRAQKHLAQLGAT